MSIGRGIGRGRLTLHGWMGLQTPVDSTFSSRVPHTIQIIKNVDNIQFSQASTSSSVLTTLDICQHDAKSFVSITESQKLCIGFFLIMTHSTKKGIILCDCSSWVNQTSTMGAWGGWLRARCSETGQRSQELHAKVLIWPKYDAWQFMLFHSMSNGATCKYTGLVVSHTSGMHVSDEYGVLYAKWFGRLLGTKV